MSRPKSPRTYPFATTILSDLLMVSRVRVTVRFRDGVSSFLGLTGSQGGVAGRNVQWDRPYHDRSRRNINRTMASIAPSTRLY